MFVANKIQVLTVNCGSVVAYQQVFVNDEKQAEDEYNHSLKMYSALSNFNVTLKTF